MLGYVWVKQVLWRSLGQFNACWHHATLAGIWQEPFVSRLMALLLFYDCHRLPGISISISFFIPQQSYQSLMAIGKTPPWLEIQYMGKLKWPLPWFFITVSLSVTLHLYSTLHSVCQVFVAAASWKRSFLLNNVQICKVSHALHRNPIPLYASVLGCRKSQR